MNPPDNPEEQTDLYLGRWVAEMHGKIIAQGGTPEQALKAAQKSRYKEKPEIRFMHSPLNINLPPLYYEIRALLAGEEDVYLVGGAVRDIFADKPIRDLDFVVKRSAIKLARKVADSLGAVFYPLDSERDTGRILVNRPGQKQQVVDFAAFRGSNLDEDLKGRDFTINAMAINPKDQSVYDPLGGVADLRNKLLRSCSNSSFLDDPLRVIRAVRMALTLDLHIIPETRKLLKASVLNISNVSPERLRDEIIRILQGPKSSAGLKALDLLGALNIIFPELTQLKNTPQSKPHVHDVWSHSLSVVDHLESILAALSEEYHPETASNYFHGMMVLRIGRYRKQIAEHLSTNKLQGRSWREILFFAGLYHDIGKPKMAVQAEDGRIRFWGHEGVSAEISSVRARLLKMSNEEVERVQTIVQHHMRLHFHVGRLLKEKKMPSSRAVYRFFRDTGEAGVDICLLTLADLWATYENTLPEDTWVACLDVVRVFLEAWWEKTGEKVLPPRLIKGENIMRKLEIDSGPEVGMLIEAVREAQVIGTVHNSNEAIDYARKYLQRSRSGEIREYTNVNNTRLAYFQRPGRGVPLILVHGFPLDHTIWQPMIPYFDRNFWVINPDLPGYGLSGSPDHLDSMEGYADFLSGLMDSLRIRKAILAGHSMGGYAALAFAAKYPHRLAGLTLVSSRTSPDAPSQMESRLKMIEEIQNHGMKPVADQMAEKLSFDPGHHRYLRNLIENTPPQGAINSIKAMMNRQDTTEIARELDIPRLIIAGVKDALIPIAETRQMASYLVGSQYHEFDDVGHMPMLEVPELCSSAINNFFKTEKI
ncbi:MAG TPA: alpha/beta fold hydrolase [Anaerolineales bacterium]|nr:alpha/beta fold hydrolase [Anaerolineales bacterium]